MSKILFHPVADLRKVCFVFVLCLGLSPLLGQATDRGAAQNPRELKSQLQSLQGADRIPVLLDLTGNTVGLSAGERLEYAKEGLQLTREDSGKDARTGFLLNGALAALEAGQRELGLLYASQGLELSTQLNNEAAKARALYLVGKSHIDAGGHLEGIRNLMAARNAYQESGDREEALPAMHELAFAYLIADSPDRAFLVAQEAVDLSRNTGDPAKAGKSLQVLGQINLIHARALQERTSASSAGVDEPEEAQGLSGDVANYVRAAIDSFSEAISSYQEAKFNQGVSGCEILRGEAHFFLQDLTAPSSIRKSEKRGNFRGLSDEQERYVRTLVGDSMKEAGEGRLDEALQKLDAGVAHLNDLGLTAVTPYVLYHKADVAIRKGAMDLAVASIQAGLGIAEESGNAAQLRDLYGLSAHIHKKAGRLAEALSAFEKHASYAAQVNDEELDGRLNEVMSRMWDQELRSREAIEASRTEADKITAGYDAEKKMALMVAGGVAGAVLLILVLMMVKLGGRKKALLKAQAESKELTDQLKQAEINRNAVFKNLGQELRTRITGITGTVPLLHDSQLNPFQESCMNIIEMSTRAVSHLIDDISDLSRLESGDFQLREEELNLVACAERACQFFELDSSRPQVEIICEVPTHPMPKVKGDPDRIQQVLVNLIGRACLHVDQGSIHLKLEIETVPETRSVIARYAIHDTGSAMSAEEAKALFEKVTLVESAPSPIRAESMLGIPITRILVEAMKGSIVVNADPGDGTTVTVAFTFPIEGITSSSNESTFDRNAVFARKRVLVVDDNPVSMRSVDKHLAAWDMEITQAGSAIEAFKIIEGSNPFDVMVVDSKMPMMDGFELVQRIKSQPRLQDLPVVLLAAMSEADKFRDVENLSQIYLTTRPVQVSELRETVQQALERKKVVPVVAPQKRLAIPEPPRPPPPRPSQAAIATRGFERVAVPANAAIRKDLRILLAEDNAVNQKVTSLLLKKLGFAIDVVNNGKQAVEAIEQGAYDIVLMDKQMPEMDGIEATMRIRSMTHVRQPVVIALTASASLEDEVACKQANMDHFLTKPVQFEKVKEALAFATDLMTRRSRASLPGGD